MRILSRGACGCLGFWVVFWDWLFHPRNFTPLGKMFKGSKRIRKGRLMASKTKQILKRETKPFERWKLFHVATASRFVGKRRIPRQRFTHSRKFHLRVLILKGKRNTAAKWRHQLCNKHSGVRLVRDYMTHGHASDSCNMTP